MSTVLSARTFALSVSLGVKLGAVTQQDFRLYLRVALLSINKIPPPTFHGWDLSSSENLSYTPNLVFEFAPPCCNSFTLAISHTGLVCYDAMLLCNCLGHKPGGIHSFIN